MSQFLRAVTLDSLLTAGLDAQEALPLLLDLEQTLRGTPDSLRPPAVSGGRRRQQVAAAGGGRVAVTWCPPGLRKLHKQGTILR